MSGAMDVHAAMQNVLQQLQEQPQRYKLFGVYWWPVKAMLKRAGYGPAQLYVLGSYQDAETADLVPAGGVEATLARAFEEYRQNAAFPHRDGEVEDPDGGLVTIFDADAEF